ncbi:hypothetical protein HPULCUR_009751 [Helicostylum pulchrum]|uniref:Rab-GAP TBC domain-containing protein n=1 Tax=Helicostylum pulchrum TaxID=562976 RepID=A0ABP9YBD1_9FUNG
MHSKENNGLHQAFQYLSSLSAHSIFSRKSNSILHEPETHSIITTQESVEDFSPFTSRSNSNITISSSIDSPTPSIHCLEEPWRLLEDGNIQHDYFFSDRQDLYNNNNDQIERDSYGFKRPTQWIQIKHLHQFDIYYQPILDKQQQTWNSMLTEFGGIYPTADNLILKTNVRNGIPSQHRGKMWMHYSGAKSKMQDNPELYQSLVNTALSMGDHNEYAEIIQRDLHRTFPDNSEFACEFFTQRDGTMVMESPETNRKLSSLRRILLAFSIHSPHIGYCQSLNYLAGFFLLFVEEEEEAFWMMVSTVHDYMPKNMYDVTMEGANIDQAVLMMVLQERLAKSIWDKINNNSESGLPPITLVTSHWFLTMFINILPVETVLRIWDCFFIEGYSVMFRVALTIIQMNKDRISKLQDPIEIFQILQNMPRRLIDCATFMEYVFSDQNLFAAIDQDHIIDKRNRFKASQKHC